MVCVEHLLGVGSTPELTFWMQNLNFRKILGAAEVATGHFGHIGHLGSPWSLSHQATTELAYQDKTIILSSFILFGRGGRPDPGKPDYLGHLG